MQALRLRSEKGHDSVQIEGRIGRLAFRNFGSERPAAAGFPEACVPQIQRLALRQGPLVPI
ncbi:hypothetical protein OAQ47_01125 [Paracoccaceae bacterium]|nr:hypothetical protein [Paracoccaceae bacterium]